VRDLGARIRVRLHLSLRWCTAWSMVAKAASTSSLAASRCASVTMRAHLDRVVAMLTNAGPSEVNRAIAAPT
jgi:hypothetical protein